jgi:hypothetical protein
LHRSIGMGVGINRGVAMHLLEVMFTYIDRLLVTSIKTCAIQNNTSFVLKMLLTINGQDFCCWALFQISS